MKVPDDLFVHSISTKEVIIFQATPLSDGYMLLGPDYVGIMGSAVKIVSGKSAADLTVESSTHDRFFEQFTRPLKTHRLRSILYPEYLKVKRV